MIFDAISLDIIENIYWGNKLMTYRIHHENCDFVEAKRSSPSVDAYSPGLNGLTCVRRSMDYENIKLLNLQMTLYFESFKC